MNTPVTNLKKISSVDDCLQIVEELRKEKGAMKRQLFYRGQGAKGWPLAPSLFQINVKGNNYSKHERRIFQEFTSRQSLAFSEDRSMFDRLIRAQHYTLPTRLLDLTLSPLVALFFACSSQKHKDADGELMIVSCKKEKVKYYDSHTVSCLANLAQLSNEDRNSIRWIQKIMDSFLSEKSDLLKNIETHSRTKIKEYQNYDKNKQEEIKPADWNCDADGKYKKIIRNVRKQTIKNFNLSLKLEKSVKRIASMCCEIILTETQEAFREILYLIIEDERNLRKSRDKEINDRLRKLPNRLRKSSDKILQKSSEGALLFQFILEERPGFQNLINFESLFNPLLVYPRQSNERIIAQQGAFLLFGLNQRFKDNEIGYTITRHPIAGGKEGKAKILKQLEWLGINQSFIYPRLEKCADYLRDTLKQCPPEDQKID